MLSFVAFKCNGTHVEITTEDDTKLRRLFDRSFRRPFKGGAASWGDALNSLLNGRALVRGSFNRWFQTLESPSEPPCSFQ